MIKFLNGLIILGVVFLIYSCSDPMTGNVANQPPQTYLSLFPDSVIRPGSSLKKISWWGDDPDGYIVGFRISLDSINWSDPVNKNDSTFFFNFNGNDTIFRVWVAAVDDKGLTDPTPASNLYPVINTPPTMKFDVGTELPDTTFPVATFKWTGTDPDGNSTIKNYFWSLNDTLNFRRIPGGTSMMTLNADSGLVTNSNNILYMKAVDNAGAFSKIVRMPDTSKTWYVKKVTSKILLIKDMPLSEFSMADTYFAVAFDTIKYDVLDIKSRSGALIPKIINPMFTETLKLFNIVVWSAYQGGNNTANDANFSLAQQSLPFYLQTGKKLFFTSGFPNIYQSQGGLINFAPVDSIKSCRMNTILETDTISRIDNTYPVLTPDNTIFAVRGVYVPSNVKVLYKMRPTSACSDSSIVAFKDTDTNPKIVFMSLPVYYINGNPSNTKALFRRILIQDFGYSRYY